MTIRKLIGVAIASVALAAVCGCSSTSKTETGAGAKACCAKCPAGCKCGGTGSCCKS